MSDIPIEVVSDLADLIKAPTEGDRTNVRVGIVTGLETDFPWRVQLDIFGTAWLSRSADAFLSVGDKAWAVQQGEVVIIGGRLNLIAPIAPIGSVVLYAGSSGTLPYGWSRCNGQELSRDTYAYLFSVVGTAYGAGDGTTTFNIPDLDDRFPLGAGSGYSRGDTGGQESVSLSSGNLPGHTHSVNGQGSRSDIATGGSTTVSTPSGGNTGSTGSGSAHNNMPPYVGIYYIIRTV